MTDKRENIFETMSKDILNSTLSEQEKNKMLKNIQSLKNKQINLMITGATGSGKSSTINALFDANVAKVGISSDPETMDITKYTLKNLVLWDSPGLGDGTEADARHSKNIIKKLSETDSNGNYLIDLVLVILDGSTRDYGTDYKLINKVIIPNLGKDAADRILVAINKCDKAKSRHWNYETNQPDEVAKKFLEEKVESVRHRIRENTGVDIEPIYYSAGEKDSDDEKQNPYNLSKLLYYIIQHTPKDKQLAYVDNISQDNESWKDNDNLKDYSQEVQQGFVDRIRDWARAGSNDFRKIGEILGMGKTGEKIGKIVGTGLGVATEVIGAVGKSIEKFLDWIF